MNVQGLRTHNSFGLGTDNANMCVQFSMEIPPNTLQSIRPICPNRPIIWDIFERNPYHMSIVRDFYYKGPT